MPQPLPTRAPLLSGMMFGGGVRSRVRTNNIKEKTNNLQTKSLDTLVDEVTKKSSTDKISNNNNNDGDCENEWYYVYNDVDIDVHFSGVSHLSLAWCHSPSVSVSLGRGV